MKFSIVTPTFNHKKYIETTIKSVLVNKSKNYELEYIIVDGASTDGTQDIVKTYIDNVDLFISEPDDGQSDAINKGFTHATGDIYAYINSDDYYYPEAFEKVAKIFNENPDIDVIYGNCLFVTEDEQFLRYFTEIEPYNEYRLTSCTDFIMQPSCFWRKEIYDQCGGFTKDFHFGFDWELWCRMAEKGAKFHYINELLAVNREFEMTKTSTGGDKRLAELKQMNMLHKQSFLPHAYYSYASSEYRSHNEGKTFVGKVKWKLKAYFYRLLSFENIFYNYKNYGANNLYGLHHHSQDLNREALISLPYYKNDQESIIGIVLSSHLVNQNVQICVNGEDIGQKDIGIHSNIILHKVSKLDIPKIDISFKFTHEINGAHNLKQKLLGKTSTYAATLHTCKVISNEELSNFNLQKAK